MPQLLRMAYISRCARDLSESDLRTLGRSSAARNETNKISGLLVTDGASFVQALEGPEAAVRATMRRILLDPRHTDLEILSDLAVAHRAFGRWSMKLYKLDDTLGYEKTESELERHLTTVRDTPLGKIFATFSRVSRFRLVTRHDPRPRGDAEARALHSHLRLLIEQAQTATGTLRAVTVR